MSAVQEIAQTGDPSKLCAVDPWCWIKYNKLQLFGGPYQIEGHEFQVPIIRCEAQRQCAKKSPQMGGFTEILVCRSLHGLIHGKYKQGVLYLFPTSDEVYDFSRSRFKTFLRNNPGTVGRHVRDTDSTEVKRVGRGTLFLRGARLSKDVEGAQKSSSKLKSLPVDLLVGDEIDEMDEGALELAKGRLDHSLLQEEYYLANPTVPNYGIDKLYQHSDQRMWTIECPKCGRENCLEQEFPECLKRTKDGRVIRACKKCGAELNPRTGYWVAQYPSKSKDLVGWWISHLNSFYTKPETILREYEDPDTDLVRFYNRRLARAYVNAENQLQRSDVYLCCGQDAMSMASHGPCAMGVDVGDTLHVAIAQRVADRGAKILKLARVQNFNDVHDLCKRFGVTSIVFDMHPEIHAVREFCSTVRFSAFGCIYSESQSTTAAWNESSKVVTCNRTELCDATHRMVTTPGRLELPRKDDEVELFAAQCCAIAKVLEDDRKTGSKIYRYRKIDADHYRHTLNYLLLALGRVKPASRSGSVVEEALDFHYA